ncbi:hypothetical protein DESAMIL20_220 [Desulfurella amilsii]|uniref:Adenosyl-chloride synthase n=1 Tax=Desulfurella amilsii TaxID=1562698 RepID=A0A1X4XZY9_9BACT|nr:hypothetical protein DESAMIL20_220 [Desulfurella amilsii]
MFLSDFGYLDPYVGIVKGAIKSSCNVEIIDLSHNIDSFKLKSAQFILKHSYKYFPEGSIFLVVVDPEVGSFARPIVVKRKNYTFVGRDNGILTFDNDFKVFSVDEGFKDVSATFHARDVFAKIVCKIINKKINLTKIESFEKFNIEEVVFSKDEQKGEVLWIDKFGNIITNIKTNSNNYELVINGFTIEKKAQYYAEFKESFFAIEGSFGFLEIAKYQDSAAKILNVKIGNNVIVRSKNESNN